MELRLGPRPLGAPGESQRGSPLFLPTAQGGDHSASQRFKDGADKVRREHRERLASHSVMLYRATLDPGG